MGCLAIASATGACVWKPRGGGRLYSTMCCQRPYLIGVQRFKAHGGPCPDHPFSRIRVSPEKSKKKRFFPINPLPAPPHTRHTHTPLPGALAYELKCYHLLHTHPCTHACGASTVRSSASTRAIQEKPQTALFPFFEARRPPSPLPPVPPSRGHLVRWARQPRGWRGRQGGSSRGPHAPAYQALRSQRHPELGFR